MAKLPRSEVQTDFVTQARRELHAIIHGEDSRLITVVGPCSIHDLKAGREYAEKLSTLAAELKNRMLILMRVYFEKPRTTIGWKGLINDPHLDGSFVINADDHYAITLRDLKGRSNSGLLWQSIKALKDQSPTVRITHPDPDLMVHEEQEVKIRMNAEDDFGVTELGLAFYVLGEDEMRETVKTLESPLRKTRGRTVFDLGRMILPSGAIIAYYAYGKDNDTVNGPKEGVSVLHFIRVYEEEELADQDSMQREQQRQAEDLARAAALEAALAEDPGFLSSKGLELTRRRYTVTLDHADYRIAAYFEDGRCSVTSADKRTATSSAAPRKQQFVESVEDALLVMAQFLADETR